MAKCWNCNVNEIEEPQMCCSDSDGMCGCKGYPIYPPYCEICLGDGNLYFKQDLNGLPQAIGTTE